MCKLGINSASGGGKRSIDIISSLVFVEKRKKKKNSVYLLMVQGVFFGLLWAFFLNFIFIFIFSFIGQRGLFKVRTSWNYRICPVNVLYVQSYVESIKGGGGLKYD